MDSDAALPRRIVVVLPEDAGAPATRPLAPGASLAGPLGVIDNGLWRSMPVIVGVLGDRLRAEGGPPLRTTPFDHLAADFDDQRAALGPFAGKVVAAVAGLGA
jgi:hypothetical protein